jgi:hypothetical protein
VQEDQCHWTLKANRKFWQILSARQFREYILHTPYCWAQNVGLDSRPCVGRCWLMFKLALNFSSKIGPTRPTFHNVSFIMNRSSQTWHNDFKDWRDNSFPVYIMLYKSKIYWPHWFQKLPPISLIPTAWPSSRWGVVPSPTLPHSTHPLPGVKIIINLK